ncbi:SusC/RagA family TonB-linked outer membrane protein [Pedobacter sp.]|jgi:TonB-linked SusC/RagA family outer membrane protein|uniref:SusC/RagA family TonB-linked outer membrane protein n=1 Tax=Pedobacter sp. TaxID=1411316 RepID=UPI002C5E3820|nr:SusC/RagA family TonB-linked outer membrane protein [Pedobacter sp.]HWW42227.1 SusC/RagA family TonB-linked outer membrane protein [Pedobacter sp.]
MKKTITLLILLCCCTLRLWAQEKEISGKITASDDGQPIPGVSVTVKGTSRGTATDVNGNFSIRAGATETLLFRSIGFLPKEVLVGSQLKISVALASDNQNLSEVVVTALGIKRSDKSLGYSVQQVKGDDLTLTKQQNVIGALAGKVAGVQVVGSSGASMGGTQKIKIRGANSLTGKDQPLMVVDGTPVSNQNFSNSTSNGADYGNLAQDINPEDIESVSVLKGPAASALYGLRGQYGVILITTKKGKKGAKQIDIQLNSAFSIEKTGNFMPLQNIYGVGNSQSFLTLANGQKYLDGNDESWGPKMDGTPVRMYYSFYPQDARYGQLTPFVPHPDNIKDLYETGYNLNNNLSVAGGNENSAIRFSYNNGYVNGVLPNTWLKKNNLSVNGSLDITKKLTIGANLNYANNSAQRPTEGYQGSGTGSVQWFQRNIDINELRNYKYPDGTILNWNVNPNKTTGTITNANNKPSDWNNPFFDLYENLNKDNRDRFFGDVNASFQVLPELKLSGFIRSDRFTQNLSHQEALGGRNVDGYWTGKYQNTENNYEFLGQYNKTFGELSVNANLGANILTQQYSYVRGETQGGLSSPGFYSVEASVDRPLATSYLRRKEVRSMYATTSFGYKDTYFLEGTIRNDNSSALPKGKNSYWYPSVSGSFVFSELIKWTPLSYGKVRMGYAIAGSDLAAYQTSYYYETGAVYNNGTTPINTQYVPDQLNNPDVKPSFAHSFEAGVDVRFIKNRLGLEFTYYKQENQDEIIPLTVSGATGYSSYLVNAGKIENKGIEVTLTGKPVVAKRFSWDATLNFSRNRSTIKELYPGIDVYQLDANVYSKVNIYLNAKVGAPFGNLVGQGYKRDAATGKILLDKDNLPMYEANHDFGSVLPKFTGGFVNNFHIGQFDISAMIDFQSGGKFFSWSKMLAVKSGQAAETAALNDKGNNVRDAVANGGGVKVNGISSVTGQEVTAYVEARNYYRNILGTQVYEEWLMDASYVKLREVSLGYNLGKKMLNKLPFKSVKVALIARNPVMIWQKAPKGLDPSDLSAGSASISWIEKGQLPTVRSFGVNLNLTF